MLKKLENKFLKKINDKIEKVDDKVVITIKGKKAYINYNTFEVVNEDNIKNLEEQLYFKMAMEYARTYNCLEKFKNNSIQY